MPQYNIQIIRNILSQKIAESTQDVLQKNLIILQNSISSYLIQFSLFKMRLDTIKRQTQQIYSMINVDEQDYSCTYSIFKQLNVYETGINNLIKDGYEIVHRLRQWITGQVIPFQIGTDYRGKLYQGQFSIDQIMKKAKVGYSSKSILSLRLEMSKTNVVQKSNELENILNQTIQEGTSVYSHIFRYFYHERAGENPNKGNIYQVYRSVIADRTWANPNKIPPPITEGNTAAFLQKRFLQIKANNLKSTQGGDTVHLTSTGSIIEQQDKFISSNPSLMTIYQIENTLVNFNNSLTNFLDGKGNFYEEMISLWTREDKKANISTILEQEAFNQSKEKIYQNIQKLKLAVYLKILT